MVPVFERENHQVANHGMSCIDDALSYGADMSQVIDRQGQSFSEHSVVQGDFHIFPPIITMHHSHRWLARHLF